MSPVLSNRIVVLGPESGEYVSEDPEYIVQDETLGADSQGKKKRVRFCHGVTVNVYTTGGSSTGGSGSGSSTGGDGAGGAATLNNGSNAGEPGTSGAARLDNGGIVGGRGTGDAATVDNGSSTGGLGRGGPATLTYGSNTEDGRDLVSHLATQLADLSRKVEQLTLLGPRPVIDSGTWSTDYVRPWYRPQPLTSGRVSFRREFTSVPTVIVSITSADISNESNYRVRVYASAVDREGFTMNVLSWEDTKLYSCGVSWIAMSE